MQEATQTMSDQTTTAPAAPDNAHAPQGKQWERLLEDWKTQLADLDERRPKVFMGLAVAVTLLGYLIPLSFPLAAVLATFSFIGAVQDAGLSAFSTHLGTLGIIVGASVMSVSLWRLRVGEPEGEPVTRKQVPELFQQVNEIRAAFQAPTITDVHISDGTKLTVHRVPRSGYPFMFRHVLVTGMPTLQCLSLDQFRCTLAACIGELSVLRTDTTGWITQMARTWELYRVAVAGQWTPAAVLYRVFLAWYVPVMKHLAGRKDRDYRLRRDHYALEVASDDLVVEMIAGETVMQRFLQEIYWPTVYKTAEHSSTPNFKVFRNMEAVFRRRVSAETVQIWIREAFVEKWRNDDNDPGLRSRLHEVGHSEIHYCPTEAEAAAHVLLGASYQWVIDRCDARWAEAHQEEWMERHTKTRRQYGKLDMLREVLHKHGLKGAEAMEYAALVKRYGTAEEAREAYETILRLNPDDARINFGVGKYLLSQKDARGVKLLEHAMQRDKRLVDPACRLISGFVVNHKLQDTVRTYVSTESKGKRSSAA